MPYFLTLILTFALSFSLLTPVFAQTASTAASPKLVESDYAKDVKEGQQQLQSDLMANKQAQEVKSAEVAEAQEEVEQVEPKEAVEPDEAVEEEEEAENEGDASDKDSKEITNNESSGGSSDGEKASVKNENTGSPQSGGKQKDKD